MKYELKTLSYFDREELSIITESYTEALGILQQLKPSDSGRIIEYDNAGSYSEIAYKKCGSSSIYRWK